MNRCSPKVRLAAADELDDFVAVAGGDQGLRPERARENFAVALDGDTAAVQAELAQQVRDRCARFGAAIFAVHGNCDGGLQVYPPAGTFGLARN